MRRICTLAVVVVLSTTSLFAAELGKYNGWNELPAAYYLTAEEREQWSALQTAAEAEQFVQTYNAARGGETFTKELNKRIAMADKYLTVGDTPGSKSLRGKIVILLGPPSSMDVAVRQTRSAGRSSSASMSMNAGGESSGASAADMVDLANREGMAAGDSGLRDYTLTYMAASLPTNKDATLVVEVNAKTGKDRVANKKAAAELDQLLEAAAKKSIIKK